MWCNGWGYQGREQAVYRLLGYCLHFFFDFGEVQVLGCLSNTEMESDSDFKWLSLTAAALRVNGQMGQVEGRSGHRGTSKEL